MPTTKLNRNSPSVNVALPAHRRIELESGRLIRAVQINVKSENMMLTRKLIVPIALSAAVGAPLMYNDYQNTTDFEQAAYDPLVSGTPADWGSLPMIYAPAPDLSEIVRFDISPDWIASRWSRVSTAPSLDRLQGMRVALVTGPNPWDLCGALTYYFDDERQVQRIQFRGTTGDTSMLVQYLTQRQGFQAHRTRAAGYYTASKGRRVTGFLRLDQAATISADDPNDNYSVVMELNRPDGKREVSAEMVELARQIQPM